MRILNINSYYFSSTVHRQLNNEIEKNNIDTLTYVPLYEGYEPRDECTYDEDVRVCVSNCYKLKDRFVFYTKQNKILEDIDKKIELNKFDLIHAHSLFSNGYTAMKIKEKHNIPYIVAVRDTDLNKFFKYMIHLKGLGIKTIKNADKIIFFSKAYMDRLICDYIPADMKEETRLKSVVMPNGIDDFWFENINEVSKNEIKNEIKFISVGSINKRKNILTTIKAIKLLRLEKLEVKLTIVGKVENKIIYKKIRKLDFVEYIAPVSKEKLLKIYRENDIFVMPSLTETFGLVYAEAMSQGLPIIYTQNQGFDGQFKNGEVGYSVNCNRPVEIKEKIKKILEDYKSMSNNCIVNVKKFKWKSISENYSMIYQQILKVKQ